MGSPRDRVLHPMQFPLFRLPTSAWPGVAEAIGVNGPPRMTVPIRAPGYLVSGLHVACVVVRPILACGTPERGLASCRRGGRTG